MRTSFIKIDVKYYCKSYICKISAKNHTVYGFLYWIDGNNSVFGTDALHSVQLTSAVHQMPHTVKTGEEKQSNCEHSHHLVPKIGKPGGKPLSPRIHGVVIQQTTGNHTYYCFQCNYTQQGPRTVFHLRMYDGK